MTHRNADELAAHLGRVKDSPSDSGTVELIVRRPEIDGREILERGALVIGEGLEGDNYLARGNSKTPDGAAHPEAQLNIMNSRAIAAVAGDDHDRWALAGDQLYVDFDLSRTNLPAGTLLAVGTAVVKVSAKPHNGCAKFAQRFGIDAARWVNSDDEVRLRGINATVAEAGSVAPGDAISKLVGKRP